MKASELIEALQKLITDHGDRYVYSEADWSFVYGVEVGTEKRERCVVAPVDTEDRQGEYEPVDVFVLTG
jgi:hypothetical protein